MLIEGFASPVGTARFAQRFAGTLAEGHFREIDDVRLSSIGLGSYLGNDDAATDAAYTAAMQEALRSGVNVIDSAINYRCQRSERALGKAFHMAIDANLVARDEIFVCTKGGYLPFDGAVPTDPSHYIKQTYIATGIVKPDEIVQGCHAMTPQYLADQLARSRANLGVETIDLYYLHNPETQLAEIDAATFATRLTAAFVYLESQVAEGKIRMYGTATWNGYRVDPNNREHLSLAALMECARAAGGPDHHFKVVQLPFNMAMPEALLKPTQQTADGPMSFLQAAADAGLTTVASASLLQGQLTRPLPPEIQQLFSRLPHASQCALQFVRSSPGITTALVGMKTIDHVRENLTTATVPPLTFDEFRHLFAGKEDVSP